MQGLQLLDIAPAAVTFRCMRRAAGRELVIAGTCHRYQLVCLLVSRPYLVSRELTGLTPSG
ncbi:MAG: hypothetical protein N2B05_05470, partial [Gemmatimonadales bacterium]